MLGACPTDGQAACSLRKTAANLAAGRNGPKDSLTRCEVEAFPFLAPGHRIVVLDHETGEIRRGSVDAVFPHHGFVSMLTDLGERKLLDIALHTVWRSDTRQVCDSQRYESGSLIPKRRYRILAKTPSGVLRWKVPEVPWIRGYPGRTGRPGSPGPRRIVTWVAEVTAHSPIPSRAAHGTT